MATKAATLTTRARKTRPRWVRRVKRVFAVFFLLFLIGSAALGILFAVEMRHASELIVSLPEKLRQYSQKPTEILSADGQVLFTIQSEFREPVKYDQVPKLVRDAMLAAEDKRFFDHNGVDYWAMGRILLVGAREGRLSQGGSTLTMQLAKRFYSEGEKTFNRKLQDVALAVTMERDMTKEQILTLYLNTMYFGEKAYGIQAASDVYFGKPLNKLTVAEAAMLARCVRRPSDENPVKNLDKAVTNRNVVLKIMLDEKMITQAQYDNAIVETPHISPPKQRITSHLNKAPYFVAHVLQYLEQEMPDLDLKRGGYTIYTTVDTRMEDYAEKQVRQFVREHRNDNVNDAAFVVMDKNGKILAEVGGLNYGKDQFNIITQAQLQPGSSFKPFVYATALSAGVLSMNDQLENEPFTYAGTENWAEPWQPHNSSDKENSGPVSVERAMASSLNIPAAHVMERVGPQAVAARCTGSFGFRSKLAVVPSMALGAVNVRPIEMAQGYSVFMLHGSRATPYVVTKIVGPDGSIVRSFDPVIVPDQLESWVADDIDLLLKGVVEGGTASSTGISDIPNARGKTGTTSDHKDAWFCGYTDGLVGVGWVGNNVIRNGRARQLPMARSMWGATAAAGIWKNVMERAHARFASPVPAARDQGQDPFRGRKSDVPQDQVKVTAPDETLPPDGTTGGDGKPIIVVPNPTTGATGGASTTGGDTAATTGSTGGNPPDPNKNPPDQNPATTTPPKHDPPKRHTTDESDTVQVEVCAESGMRATIYCPETVTRTFKRGQEPRRRCTIHGGR